LAVDLIKGNINRWLGDLISWKWWWTRSYQHINFKINNAATAVYISSLPGNILSIDINYVAYH